MNNHLKCRGSEAGEPPTKPTARKRCANADSSLTSHAHPPRLHPERHPAPRPRVAPRPQDPPRVSPRRPRLPLNLRPPPRRRGRGHHTLTPSTSSPASCWTRAVCSWPSAASTSAWAPPPRRHPGEERRVRPPRPRGRHAAPDSRLAGAAARELGYSPDEWMADPTLFARSLHPDDHDRVMAKLAADRPATRLAS